MDRAYWILDDGPTTLVLGDPVDDTPRHQLSQYRRPWGTRRVGDLDSLLETWTEVARFPTRDAAVAWVGEIHNRQTELLAELNSFASGR